MKVEAENESYLDITFTELDFTVLTSHEFALLQGPPHKTSLHLCLLQKETHYTF